MTDKETYRELCKTEISINLYSQDWYLDCVCKENNWNVLLFLHENAVEAAMPFYMPLKGFIIMPPFAQSLGIWFNPAFEMKNYSKNLYRKQQITEYFIKKLPKNKIFVQSFHYSFSDWLPFYWNNYCQYTRYNYILPDIRDKKLLYKNFNDNIKRNIGKAEKILNIRANVSIDLFIEIVVQTYKRQGEKPYHLNLIKRLIKIVRERKQGEIWGAYDKANRLCAAVFIVWQNNCAWYIAGGGNTDFRKTGGHAFAMWKAINELPEKITSFDFEGSMNRGIERFFRSFGAVQKPYFVISKGKINLFQRIFLKLKRS